MTFRTPLSSATPTAVDTAGGAPVAGVRVYQTTDGKGNPKGVVEFDDGVSGDTPGTISIGSFGALGGGSLSIKAGSFAGVTGPELDLEVDQAGRVIAQLNAQMITTAPAADDATIVLASGWVIASGRKLGLYTDATGCIRLDGLFQNTGALAAGANNILIATLPTGYAPAQNRFFLMPLYHTAVVACVGIRSGTGQIVLDLLGGAVAASSFWDPSTITYNPNSIS